ncbi:MAG: HAMP domain-containing histidine kinase [Clostridium sp.]|nr:HAMP domain-containing histidine kinase [Clostridium sp.]
MIKKRKVYISIILAVLVLYITSVGLCYTNVKKSINNYFYSDMATLEYELYNSYGVDSIFSPDSFACNNSAQIAAPYRIVLYDDQYNEVSRTGAYIAFTVDMTEKYCRLDDYLTEDIIEQILNNENSGNYQATFSYVNENDKLIPVALEYKNTKLEIVDKIVFTDKTPDAVLNYPYDYFDIIGVPSNVYEFRDLQYIDQEIESRQALEKYNFQASQGDYIENEYYAWTDVSFLEEDSETVDDFHTYYALLAGRASVDTYARHSEEFVNDCVILTVVFAAAGAVVITIAYFILRKSEIKSAKYAFTNAAAHELKTPLAVIENQCEFILEGINEDKTKDYVNSIYKESLRMNALLTKLLNYNKLADLDTIKKEKADLSVICKKELAKYESLAAAKNISFNINIADTAFVNCSDELLSLVIDNFLSNAIKFAPVSSSVAVKLIEENKKFRLSVTNSFDGELDGRIWDLLYTKDTSRSDKSTGMGLPLSKEILKLHRYKYGFNHDNGKVEFYFIAK